MRVIRTMRRPPRDRASRPFPQAGRAIPAIVARLLHSEGAGTHNRI